jgi:hypothetical protein
MWGIRRSAIIVHFTALQAKFWRCGGKSGETTADNKAK